jgi:hypothetical protein
MKKLILLTAVAVLGVSLSSGAFAQLRSISGTVYFLESTGETANCNNVYLYSDVNCENQVNVTPTDCCGGYSFHDLQAGKYYVKAIFTELDCYSCDWYGTCSYTVTDCVEADVTDHNVSGLNFDLGLTACFNSSCE